MRVVIITLDNHLASACGRAEQRLRQMVPGLTLALHSAADWNDNPKSLNDCRRDIASADIIVANMLFMEDHIEAVLPDLKARRDHCDAMMGAIAASDVIRLTKLGRFRMDGTASGPMALLKKLRGGKDKAQASAAEQMKMLRRIPQILRFIPGTAQDVRAYFMAMQYWLAGSDDNVVGLVASLIARYADGPRRPLRSMVQVEAPITYPEVGVYHPAMKGRISDRVSQLPGPKGATGTVGLLVMRSYLLAGNAQHYDGVIAGLETKGLRVVPAFASGLDARPAIDQFFKKNDRPTIDALVSLTGFSLVGGPAYNDSKAAEVALTGLDVPYIAAQPIEFQTTEQWAESERGLLPIEQTIMVAIPELDGATGSMVFGGRSAGGASPTRDMRALSERVEVLAARVAKMVALRRSQRADRKVAIVLFNFPPNGGSVGTAAYLSVFASLQNTLQALAREGYSVDVPQSVDVLRKRIIEGNSATFGAGANVHARIDVDDHVRQEPHLAEIEAQWGAAPGRQQSDGQSIFVLGSRFGNVFVGIQPSMGYEGDPMRLLFEKGFTPTHAFTAFYRWIRQDFGAHAVLHFGTHGALEFMPGKQTGLSAKCWPERLIADIPNFYLYAANNPSEGTLAKRRSAATLISYMTPPVTSAGLYRGLLDLKTSLDQWRSLDRDSDATRDSLIELIQSQAVALDLASLEPQWVATDEARVNLLRDSVLELEMTLIPHGLHVVGQVMTEVERIDLLLAIGESAHGQIFDKAVIEAVVAGRSAKDAAAAGGMTVDDATVAILTALAQTDFMLQQETELAGIVRALDARFVPPAPGGDVLRTPSIFPTGRNLHGFDPFRIPSAFAVKDGALQADRLLARHLNDGHRFPESVALVLWGTDNLKSEGGPIAQVLALIGARPRFDTYGRLCGADLIPLDVLGRPRIDVVITLSGIFRDLLPLQIKLLAEASFLAASADEPLEQNFVRKHALAYQAKSGCDLETASLRVFGNAEGTYGANVNHLVDNGRWGSEDELAETYSRRKGFAYGRAGKAMQQPELLQQVLANVELTYQNLESVELGVTTVDTYFDTLGGISGAVRRAKGSAAPVYIGDQTRGAGTVRTLGEQIALETRTRVLNPKWYDSMLSHGYEGVRHIEAHVTNTMGWSATTGQVAPWVYQGISHTFVLDEAMRQRIAALNPAASAKVANRLLEAHARNYWTPDAATLAALRRAGEELEDRLEGLTAEEAAA